MTKRKEEIRYCDNCGLMTSEVDINCRFCNNKLRVILQKGKPYIECELYKMRE